MRRSLERKSCVHLLAGAGLAMLGLFEPAAARADDDIADIQGLLSEQIVTSASKQAEGASSAPALSTSLSAEDLRRYGIKTLAEAIDFLSLGVAASDDLNGGEIGARGVLITQDRGSHFLLLIDGHAMNDPARGSAEFGTGSGIPLELIDHIEVVVGPGSVLYGSNAMLGLINVVTKQAKDFAGTHAIVESAVPVDIRAALGIGYKLGSSAEITGQVQYYKQDGPDFWFDAENTGIDRFTGQPGRNTRAIPGNGIWGGDYARRSYYAEAPAAILKLSLGDTEIDLRGSYYRHATPTGVGDFDDPDTADKERRASIDIKHQHTISALLRASARAYGDYYNLQSNLITSRGSNCPFGVITCNYYNSATGFAGGLELQTSWDWTTTGQFVTMAGVDLRGRKIQTSSDVTDVATGGSLYPATKGLDVIDTIIGAYLQQTASITDDWNLNGGLRVDHDPRFSFVVTPRLATSLKVWTGGTIKAAYAEAFRAPSWDETNNATSVRIQSEPLLPEKVRSIEASVQQQAGAHRLTIGGFYSQWSDLVGLHTLSDAEAIQAIRDGLTSVPFTPGVQLTQYRNLSAIDNYGLNAGLEGTLGYDRFHYGLTVTLAQAKQSENGSVERLPVAPRLFGNARIAYVLGGDLPTLALAGHFMGDRATQHTFDGGFVPSPYAKPMAETRLTISGNVPGIKGLSYRAIGNYIWANRGPYIVGPVRTAIPTQTTAQLNPIDQLRFTIGLMYTL